VIVVMIVVIIWGLAYYLPRACASNITKWMYNYIITYFSLIKHIMSTNWLWMQVFENFKRISIFFFFLIKIWRHCKLSQFNPSPYCPCWCLYFTN